MTQQLKALSVLTEDPGSTPNYPYGTSQPSITGVPGNQHLPRSPWAPGTHMLICKCEGIHGNTQTNLKESFKGLLNKHVHNL